MARMASARRSPARIPWATLLAVDEGIPLHRRITATIREQMDQGLLRPGDVLPPEVELARQFDVSRHTLRVALEALVRAGRLERQRGRGTVVKRPPIEQSLARFYSLAEEMQLRGTDLQTQVLARGRLSPEDDLAARACERLGIGEAQQIGYVLRLRLVEGTPVFLETITFPVALCPYLLEVPAPGRADVGAAPFYETLEQRSHLAVTRARETFRPLLVSGYEARLLGVPSGSAVFEAERLSFVDEQPVEWRRTLARGDRYLYAVDLVNPREEGRL
ncbi:MAG TPA: GntR family transcriptional regulator [Ktedonobacterales bacterium]|nr:GntR family transcriptional regulator [Ktedonobacterales bacterium]